MFFTLILYNSKLYLPLLCTKSLLHYNCSILCRMIRLPVLQYNFGHHLIYWWNIHLLLCLHLQNVVFEIPVFHRTFKIYFYRFLDGWRFLRSFENQSASHFQWTVNHMQITMTCNTHEYSRLTWLMSRCLIVEVMWLLLKSEISWA